MSEGCINNWVTKTRNPKNVEEVIAFQESIIFSFQVPDLKIKCECCMHLVYIKVKKSEEEMSFLRVGTMN